jgi:hypothetical protein
VSGTAHVTVYSLSYNPIPKVGAASYFKLKSQTDASEEQRRQLAPADTRAALS